MDEQKMDELEKQLKNALAREEAPAWFEARVMNAVNSSTNQRVDAARRPWWQFAMGTAVAALVVIGVGTEWAHRAEVERIRAAQIEMQEREAGEAAKAKLQLALRITSTKLAQIQRRIDAQRN
jgi:hypothetical protein